MSKISKEFESTECDLLNGNKTLQCFLARSLPIARIAIGYDELPLIEVKKVLCQSENGNREELCPVLKEIRTIGIKSQYARPVTNTR